MPKRMYQHRRPNASGIKNTVHHNTTHHWLFWGQRRCYIGQRTWMVWKGCQRNYLCSQGKPSLNKGGGLRHNLPKAYDAAIKKILRLSSCDNSSLSWITEPEEDHPPWRQSISDEMWYCSHQNSKSGWPELYYKFAIIQCVMILYVWFQENSCPKRALKYV